MKCPYCASLSNRVVDSRLSKEGDETRRRRVCDDCNRRFTTYERVAEALPLVVKQDGRREPFGLLNYKAGCVLTVICRNPGPRHSIRPVTKNRLYCVNHLIMTDVPSYADHSITGEVVGR